LTDPAIYLTFFSFQIGTTLAIPLFYLQRKATLWRENKEKRKDVPEHKLLWAFFCKYPSMGKQSYINGLSRYSSCIPLSDVDVLVRMDWYPANQHVYIPWRACWICYFLSYQYVFMSLLAFRSI
jgi:hypothetical protein